MTMVERIAVTPHELEQFATRVERVRRDLEAAQRAFDGRSSGVRSKPVANALDDFSKGWSDKRNDLVEHLEGVSELLRGAAQSFREADMHLATQMDDAAGQSNA